MALKLSILIMLYNFRAQEQKGVELNKIDMTLNSFVRKLQLKTLSGDLNTLHLNTQTCEIPTNLPSGIQMVGLGSVLTFHNDHHFSQFLSVSNSASGF